MKNGAVYGVHQQVFTVLFEKGGEKFAVEVVARHFREAQTKARQFLGGVTKKKNQHAAYQGTLAEVVERKVANGFPEYVEEMAQYKVVKAA